MAPAVFSVTTGLVGGSSTTPPDLDFGSRKTESETGKGRIKLIMLAVGLGVGGTEGQILEIASRLDRERFDVTVCALKGDDVIAWELRARGVRVITLNGSGKWDVRVLYRLFQFMRKERPDVIHSFIFFANLAARVVGKILRVPLRISSYRGIEGEMKGPRLAANRWTGAWANVTTCCSEAVRRIALARIGGDPARYITIPNGVDIGRFGHGGRLKKQDLGLRDGLPIIGTVCRLYEPTKGLRVLLEAVAAMIRRSPSPRCQLLIVGEGPALKLLKDFSAGLGIAPWVVFAGMRRDVSEILPLLDLFVLPSLSEGFGIAIVEAMAAGRPVVATAVGGIPEIVVDGETGLLVPPGDPSALTAAMDHLLSRPEQTRALGARGRERVHDQFSIESVVRRHEELYQAGVKRLA
ncbi:MAG: glycosyltransferase [Nitrospirae bacterium]|nr:MAG: glycosyltransferase [Nitrospirota bacterium]